MTRLLIGFILSLYSLLPGVFAHGYSPEKIPEVSAQAHFFTGQIDEAQTSMVGLPGARKAGDKIKAIEIQEDEESGSSRKYSESRNACIAFYAALNNSDIPCYFKSCLPFCEHFSYSSSYKFIIHRVIRI